MDPLGIQGSLDELPPDKLMLLIYGQPGSGKTTLAGTLADVPHIKKILYIYTKGDPGIESLRGTEHESKFAPKAIASPRELLDIQRYLNAGDHDYDAVILEAVNFINRLFMRWARKDSGHDVLEMDEISGKWSIDVWGKNAEFMQELVIYYLDLASSEAKKPIHVILTAHATYKENKGLPERWIPAVQPAVISTLLGVPNYVWYTDIEFPKESALDESKNEPLYTVRVKGAPKISAKLHGALERTGDIPAVLGRSGKRVTIPAIAERLGIEL